MKCSHIRLIAILFSINLHAEEEKTIVTGCNQKDIPDYDIVSYDNKYSTIYKITNHKGKHFILMIENPVINNKYKKVAFEFIECTLGSKVKINIKDN